MTAEDWDVAKRQAEGLLVSRARSRGTVTYSELCEAITVATLRPYSWKMIALLDEVCSEEDAARGIVLATLVVRADTGRPGRGYFTWAERAGHDVSDPEAYWQAQAEAVWRSFADGG